MKRIVLFAALALVSYSAAAAGKTVWTKVEASELNLCGKAFDTPNPYHRIDTCVYKGFTKSENVQCRVPAGLTVLFKTNATRIGVSVTYGNEVSGDAYRSYRGFDLYIKKDGKWLWAGCNSFGTEHKNPDEVRSLVDNMDDSEKECLMYMPLYTELVSCKVCVPEGAWIKTMESPFRHKVVFHGSSFTHGISCTRAGMSYPMQFMRRTGLQVIPMGFSGNCKMQTYFADVMEDIDADAFVFDPFSNPNIQMIKERLEPFVERMVKAHPDKPLIFQRTIYWEKENFNMEAHKEFQGRRDLTDSMMAELCRKYKNVYYIITDAALHNGESSTADGTHPNDNGYSLWEASIEKPILKILRRYGIR